MKASSTKIYIILYGDYTAPLTIIRLYLGL